MPPHRVYAEPFLGGGAVMCAKRPASLNIGIDQDPEAVKAVARAATASYGEAGFGVTP
jgi:site-specific DNA-adenine methylase